VIFEPLGEKAQMEEADLADLRQWQQFLRLYRQQDWEQAELQLFNLQQRDSASKLYALYAERIALFRQGPRMNNWDGVTVLESK
jgi:adenylate cyclase